MLRRTPLKPGKGFRRPERPARQQPVLTPRATPSAAVMRRADGVAGPIIKRPRQENRHLLDMAKGMPCLLMSPLCCGDPATTVACHSNLLEHGKGRGYKAHDFWTVWGCERCNFYLDQYGGASFEEKVAVFMVGHERQVLAWQRIADSLTAKPRDGAAARWALDRLAAAITAG